MKQLKKYRSVFRVAPRPRRALVMIAVMVVAGSALFIATSLLFIVQGEVAGAANTRDSAQARLLAWSGAQALMSMLDEQREAILEGRTPRVDAEFVLYEVPGEMGVVRLLPVGPNDELLVSESSRADLNLLDAAALARTGLVDAPMAEAIIALRGRLGRPFQSVAEVLQAPDLTPDEVYGPVEEMRVQSSFVGGLLGRYAGAGAVLGDAPARGLADAVTVFSFEPMVNRAGEPRIRLTGDAEDFSVEELIAQWGRTTERFDQSIESFARANANRRRPMRRDRDILRDYGTADVNLDTLLDLFIIQPADWRRGKMDINTAPLEALLTLPNLTPEQADEIMLRREDLPPDERWSPVWILREGIVDAQTFTELFDRITTRSWVYRVRMMSGILDPDDEDEHLRNAVVWEMVIDLSGARPRIAYLRDISMLETSAILAANVSLGEIDRGEDRFGDLQSRERENDDALDDGVPSGDLTGGGGLDLDSDLDFGSGLGASSGDSRPGASESGNRRPSGGSMPRTEETRAAQPRRIGRWTGGGS